MGVFKPFEMYFDHDYCLFMLIDRKCVFVCGALNVNLVVSHYWPVLRVGL